MSNFTCQAILLHLIPHLINIGFGPELAALGMTAVTLSSIIGRLGFGWLSDIIERRYVFALCYATMLVGCVLLITARAPWMVFVALAIFGPGMGGQYATRISMHRDYYGRAHYGVSQGFMMFMASIPTYIGPVYAGWMYDQYGSYIQAFTSLVLVLIVPIALILMAKRPRSH